MTKAEFKLLIDIKEELEKAVENGSCSTKHPWTFYQLGRLAGGYLKKEAERLRRNESRKSGGKRKNRADAKAKSTAK